MKEITAIIRMNMMNQTKKALTEAGVDAFFVHEVTGRGKGFVNPQLLEGVEQGYEEAASLLGEKGKLYPKRLISIIAEDDFVSDIVEAIIHANKTGESGDGKIFITPIKNSVRVRTGEFGTKALV